MKTRFNSLTPTLISKRKGVHEICRQFSRSPSKGNLKRLKTLFKSCGNKVIIESGFHCDYGDNITLGDRVFININCTMLDGTMLDGTVLDDTTIDEATKNKSTGKILLGDDCMIGPNVQLLAVSHDIDPTLRLEKHNYLDDIIIGNNVWLGGGVIVLAGITIGNNSIVGAGSVVTKNINANCFYAGNPAKKIKLLI